LTEAGASDEDEVGDACEAVEVGRSADQSSNLPDDPVMTLLHVACLELPGTLQVGIVVLFDAHDCILVVMMLFVDWMIGSR